MDEMNTLCVIPAWKAGIQTPGMDENDVEIQMQNL
jgi:hypothetical protein